mgnify:CR=1 FL=1
MYNGSSKLDNVYINYVGNIKDGTVSVGFDMNTFSKLMLDNIFYSALN